MRRTEIEEPDAGPGGGPVSTSDRNDASVETAIDVGEVGGAMQMIAAGLILARPFSGPANSACWCEHWAVSRSGF